MFPTIDAVAALCRAASREDTNEYGFLMSRISIQAYDSIWQGLTNTVSKQTGIVDFCCFFNKNSMRCAVVSFGTAIALNSSW